MIHAHLYTKLDQTPVFAFPTERDSPSQYLSRGNWLGVLEYADTWIHILSTNGEGWVQQRDVESRPPFQLHVCIRDQQIGYMCDSIDDTTGSKVNGERL